MLVVREAFVSGDSEYLPLSKQMNETEAKLFWSSVVGKMPFTRDRFLNVMASRIHVSPEVIHNSKKFLSDREILDAIENDPDMIAFEERELSTFKKCEIKSASEIIKENSKGNDP